MELTGYNLSLRDDGGADASVSFNNTFSIQQAKVVPVKRPGIIGLFDLEMPVVKDTHQIAVIFRSAALREEVLLSLARVVRNMKPLDASTMRWIETQNPKRVVPSITDVDIQGVGDYSSFSGKEKISLVLDGQLEISGIKVRTHDKGITMEMPVTDSPGFGAGGNAVICVPLFTEVRTVFFDAIVAAHFSRKQNGLHLNGEARTTP